jgi:pilus assembly protein CpaF
MFGKRAKAEGRPELAAARATLTTQAGVAASPMTPPKPAPFPPLGTLRSERYAELKKSAFNTLVGNINLTELAALSPGAARAEIRDILGEILHLAPTGFSLAEQDELIEEICNDVLGLGPIEPLLARDDISDIMINGIEASYAEVNGRLVPAALQFNDVQQLATICQRVASRIGRRVDEANPICDARLPDGSRVNIILPPLALDGPALTIRKFKRERLTLDALVTLGSLSAEAKELLEIISGSRCNVLICGGTGSGKTTLLNCMTGHIGAGERVITCEDAAELQLQQPHVVRLEIRPANLEGEGAITMRELVRNCLRMRPDRIIVGEVRGAEAFDLLQAMNTGHDGSMSTLHANSPREAIARLEGMILMAGFNLPSRAIRQMIVGAVDIVLQIARMRDGKRRVTHITEVVGMEGDIVVTQDLIVFEMQGETEEGDILGRHRFTGISRPRFAERARYFGLEKRLAELFAAAELQDRPAGGGWHDD